VIHEPGKKKHEQKKNRQGKPENKNPAHTMLVMVGLNSAREYDKGRPGKKYRADLFFSFNMVLKIT
jgi:hypothetical protein